MITINWRHKISEALGAAFEKKIVYGGFVTKTFDSEIAYCRVPKIFKWLKLQKKFDDFRCSELRLKSPSLATFRNGKFDPL